MKKMLMLASVASMIDQFNIPNIQLLKDIGYEVHVACNFEEGNTCSREKILDLKRKLKNMEIKYYQIDFSRSVSNIKKNLKAYRQVYVLMKREKYQFIHCHSPIGGVVGRLVGHRTGTKVIYTAHGFHFFKGAPIKNWVLYYPIEKFLAKYTDILITINKEDYYRGKRLGAKRVKYVPGVGIDIKKFEDICVDTRSKRKEIGVPSDATMLLSIGELSVRKNQISVIDAMEKIKNDNLYYVICGRGELYTKLEDRAKIKGIKDRVIFLGYREDIGEICKVADIFVFPSLQEGLPVALMEAMACGLPVIASRIRGNRELIDEEKGGILYTPKNCDEIVNSIKKMQHKDLKVIGEYNKNKIVSYGIQDINKEMGKIYYCDI